MPHILPRDLYMAPSNCESFLKKFISRQYILLKSYNLFHVQIFRKTDEIIFLKTLFTFFKEDILNSIENSLKFEMIKQNGMQNKFYYNKVVNVVELEFMWHMLFQMKLSSPLLDMLKINKDCLKLGGLIFYKVFHNTFLISTQKNCIIFCSLFICDFVDLL